MKTLILVLFCAVFVNARWSINYGAKHEGHAPDWREYSVFYQVNHVVFDFSSTWNFTTNIFSSTSDLPKLI